MARPQSKKSRVSEQILKYRCTLDDCGGAWEHVTCDAHTEIARDGDNVIFSHIGNHTHRRPPVLHLDPREAQKLVNTVRERPSSTPIQLITGSSLTPGAPGSSVADISPLLNNRSRLSRHRSDILASGEAPRVGGDKFVNALHDFANNHADFVLELAFLPHLMFILQSPYMASEMVKEVVLENGCEGFVTDACHSFFKDEQKLLFVTGSYSLRLRGWVPVALAYSGGQSAGHYRHYFLKIFKRMVEGMGTRMQITDEHFAQV